MAPSATVRERKLKNSKNRGNKIHLVFDEAKRRDFLTGFHKRKVQRKKEAREKLDRDLKDERKRLKMEAKENYKKLVMSHRPIPELETLLKEEYKDDDATVRIEELSTGSLAKQSNLIGPNMAKFEVSSSEEEPEGNEEIQVPGMELSFKKEKQEKVEKQSFESKKEVKKLLRKEATKNVKKSKVFQKKSKLEKEKQRKKSKQVKKQRVKLREKNAKKRH